MELLTHDMTALFAQLGLANDDISLHRFIREHPLDNQTLLPDATFWTASQAGFLRDALWHDSDWAEAIDQLDVMLRQAN
ncbi:MULTISPECIES: DUF2789 domain-containing protein [Aeromonas]|jgi:hypothetical protein|uniref:DUF2789 domain-containing protein n=1 Tax=Aeromonas taiwanensis TaxID=633417 RepID=A0A5F0K7W2_9GAMM|nr:MULTISPECIES: DUF2789 domain-containing protein [Aeromonas]MCO4203462.1 DUF2789 domain-containing protein [Aeromonas taiwanensis]QXB55040.1 DUF2789 domain-containing protein [Aeromonas sp. FDAARGOS 1415]TFF73012.1 DUF2789 domain-containing protein [Aeromonas taiwanensis]TFF73800.1 DUF2789 domain-containing protein [Aeromonas taiwanensis]TFF76841.1 DUF2789 domain-containing protein [Aeromonas taiwanensis]